MSPRIDHRPPIIAFMFLLVLAIAVIGTGARADDGRVVAGGPLGLHASASGTTHLDLVRPAERVVPSNRSVSRSGVPVTPAVHVRDPRADRHAAHTVTATADRARVRHSLAEVARGLVGFTSNVRPAHKYDLRYVGKRLDHRLSKTLGAKHLKR